MSLTANQEIPHKPQIIEPWTRRTLIALQTTAQTLAKAFSALEAVLFFMILVSGIGELAGRKLSIGWYILLYSVLLVDFYLRQQPKAEVDKKINKEEK